MTANFVEGDVFAIQIGDGNEAESISFDLDQARAFNEACKDILDRYDIDITVESRSE